MSVEEIVSSWLEDAKEDLITKYDLMGLRASGKWAESLNSTMESTDDSITANINGTDYTGALIDGRKPTTGGGDGSLLGLIKQWIDDKGITPTGGISKDSLAFLITRKIHREGTSVPNQYNTGDLISDVLTINRINSLYDDVSKEVLRTSMETIKNSLM